MWPGISRMDDILENCWGMFAAWSIVILIIYKLPGALQGGWNAGGTAPTAVGWDERWRYGRRVTVAIDCRTNRVYWVDRKRDGFSSFVLKRKHYWMNRWAAAAFGVIVKLEWEMDSRICGNEASFFFCTKTLPQIVSPWYLCIWEQCWILKRIFFLRIWLVEKHDNRIESSLGAIVVMRIHNDNAIIENGCPSSHWRISHSLEQMMCHWSSNIPDCRPSSSSSCSLPSSSTGLPTDDLTASGSLVNRAVARLKANLEAAHALNHPRFRWVR